MRGRVSFASCGRGARHSPPRTERTPAAEPAPSAFDEPEFVQQGRTETPAEQASPPEVSVSPSSSPEPVRSRPPPPAEPGKGGSQHKYLQQLIKGLATDRGFQAVIEEQVAGGQVDVGLHRDGLSIACEISVTSTPDYEAQNLAKCLRAGFTRVWAIAPDAKRKRAIQAKAKERLGEEAGKVEFLTADEAAFLLEQLVAPEPEPTIVRGYKLTSSAKTISPEQAAAKRAEIARILAGTKP